MIKEIEGKLYIEITDEELYEKARDRINKWKTKSLSDKELVIEQEKEITQYRNKLQRLLITPPY